MRPSNRSKTKLNTKQIEDKLERKKAKREARKELPAKKKRAAPRGAHKKKIRRSKGQVKR